MTIIGHLSVRPADPTPAQLDAVRDARTYADGYGVWHAVPDPTRTPEQRAVDAWVAIAREWSARGDDPANLLVVTRDALTWHECDDDTAGE